MIIVEMYVDDEPISKEHWAHGLEVKCNKCHIVVYNRETQLHDWIHIIPGRMQFCLECGVRTIMASTNAKVLKAMGMI